MKKTLKITIFTLVMFILLSVTSVKAATFKFELDGGTKKIVESNATTVGELKEEIENTIGIKKEYQVWNIGTFPINDGMVFDDGEYDFYLENENTDTITVHKRVELNDTIEVKSYYPNLIKNNEDSTNEFMGVFEYIFNNEYYGYYLDYSEGEACSEDYTKCKLAISSTDEAYKTVNIKYVYDKTTAKDIDNLTKKLGYKAMFKLNDFELVNYWLNGNSPINYSNEYKKQINYKNFYLDVRAGSDDPLVTESLGIGYYTYNGTLYKVINQIGTDGCNILYVDTDVSNDKLLDTIQKRIDNYIGKGKITVYLSEGDVDSYINNRKAYLNQYYNEEDDFYKSEIKSLEELKNTSADGKIYEAKVGNKEYRFVIGKNTEKMYTPKLITSDFKTNIEVSTDNTNTIPLDTMIQIKELTSGEEYNKILKILNISNSEMFDISLFSNSVNKYISKLENGSFEVRIPINEKFKDKNLVVYYVDDIGKVTEYPVEVSNNEAIFKTNHFSIYTLAELTEKEPNEEGTTKEEQTNNEVNNPKTGDNIVTYIVIGVVEILGIIVCAVMYLKKKKDNK